MQGDPTGCECGCGGEPRPGNRFIKGHTTVGLGLKRILTGWVEEDRGYHTPCWVWQRRLSPRGYGVGSIKGRPVRAHRALYEHVKGPVPDGLTLDHLCRVRACVNPDHLEPVTIAENVRRGSCAKLSTEKAREIRASSEPPRVLAPIYGVSPSLITMVRTNRCWREDSA